MGCMAWCWIAWKRILVLVQLFVFTNKRRSRIKTLYWDGTGLWGGDQATGTRVFYLAQGASGVNEKLELAPEALALLLDGVDLKQGSFKPWYQR